MTLETIVTKSFNVNWNTSSDLLALAKYRGITQKELLDDMVQNRLNKAEKKGQIVRLR